MKKVFICSPYSATAEYSTEENVALAERLCRAVTLAGHAPFAPHLFYTRFLDDKSQKERAMGIDAGIAWLGMADEIWIYAKDRNECSEGMALEVLRAEKFSIAPVPRWMPTEWKGVTPRKRTPPPKIIETKVVSKVAEVAP